MIFEEQDKEFNELLSKINDISLKYDLCRLRAKEYEDRARIDGIRDEAKNRADYYRELAEKYKNM